MRRAIAPSIPRAVQLLLQRHRRAPSTPAARLLTRPDLAEVLRYREHVDEAMHALIARQAGDAAFDALLALGLNHEQQHRN